jgi:hypothetical protein
MGGDDFSPDELAALRRVAAPAILSARRSGAPLRALETAARRIETALSCAVSADGSTESVGGEQSGVEWLDARTAAELLRISPRRVRQLAPQLGGEIWSGRWRFPRNALEEHQNGCSSRDAAPRRRSVDRQPF